MHNFNSNFKSVSYERNVEREHRSANSTNYRDSLYQHAPDPNVTRSYSVSDPWIRFRISSPLDHSRSHYEERIVPRGQHAPDVNREGLNNKYRTRDGFLHLAPNALSDRSITSERHLLTTVQAETSFHESSATLAPSLTAPIPDGNAHTFNRNIHFNNGSTSSSLGLTGMQSIKRQYLEQQQREIDRELAEIRNSLRSQALASQTSAILAREEERKRSRSRVASLPAPDFSFSEHLTSTIDTPFRQSDKEMSTRQINVPNEATTAVDIITTRTAPPSPRGLEVYVSRVEREEPNISSTPRTHLYDNNNNNRLENEGPTIFVHTVNEGKQGTLRPEQGHNIDNSRLDSSRKSFFNCESTNYSTHVTSSSTVFPDSTPSSRLHRTLPASDSHRLLPPPTNIGGPFAVERHKSFESLNTSVKSAKLLPPSDAYGTRIHYARALDRSQTNADGVSRLHIVGEAQGQSRRTAQPLLSPPRVSSDTHQPRIRDASPLADLEQDEERVREGFEEWLLNALREAHQTIRGQIERTSAQVYRATSFGNSVREAILRASTLDGDEGQGAFSLIEDSEKRQRAVINHNNQQELYIIKTAFDLELSEIKRKIKARAIDHIRKLQMEHFNAGVDFLETEDAKYRFGLSKSEKIERAMLYDNFADTGKSIDMILNVRNALAALETRSRGTIFLQEAHEFSEVGNEFSVSLAPLIEKEIIFRKRTQELQQELHGKIVALELEEDGRRSVIRGTASEIMDEISLISIHEQQMIFQEKIFLGIIFETLQLEATVRGDIRDDEAAGWEALVSDHHNEFECIIKALIICAMRDNIRLIESTGREAISGEELRSFSTVLESWASVVTEQCLREAYEQELKVCVERVEEITLAENIERAQIAKEWGKEQTEILDLYFSTSLDLVAFEEVNGRELLKRDQKDSFDGEIQCAISKIRDQIALEKHIERVRTLRSREDAARHRIRLEEEEASLNELNPVYAWIASSLRKEAILSFKSKVVLGDECAARELIERQSVSALAGFWRAVDHVKASEVFSKRTRTLEATERTQRTLTSENEEELRLQIAAEHLRAESVNRMVIRISNIIVGLTQEEEPRARGLLEMGEMRERHAIFEQALSAGNSLVFAEAVYLLESKEERAHRQSIIDQEVDMLYEITSRWKAIREEAQRSLLFSIAVEDLVSSEKRVRKTLLTSRSTDLSEIQNKFANDIAETQRKMHIMGAIETFIRVEKAERSLVVSAETEGRTHLSYLIDNDASGIIKVEKMRRRLLECLKLEEINRFEIELSEKARYSQLLASRVEHRSLLALTMSVKQLTVVEQRLRASILSDENSEFIEEIANYFVVPFNRARLALEEIKGLIAECEEHECMSRESLLDEEDSSLTWIRSSYAESFQRARTAELMNAAVMNIVRSEARHRSLITAAESHESADLGSIRKYLIDNFRALFSLRGLLSACIQSEAEARYVIERSERTRFNRLLGEYDSGWQALTAEFASEQLMSAEDDQRATIVWGEEVESRRLVRDYDEISRGIKSRQLDLLRELDLLIENEYISREGLLKAEAKRLDALVSNSDRVVKKNHASRVLIEKVAALGDLEAVQRSFICVSEEEDRLGISLASKRLSSFHRRQTDMALRIKGFIADEEHARDDLVEIEEISFSEIEFEESILRTEIELHLTFVALDESEDTNRVLIEDEEDEIFSSLLWNFLLFIKEEYERELRGTKLKEAISHRESHARKFVENEQLADFEDRIVKPFRVRMNKLIADSDLKGDIEEIIRTEGLARRSLERTEGNTRHQLEGIATRDYIESLDKQKIQDLLARESSQRTDILRNENLSVSTLINGHEKARSDIHFDYLVDNLISSEQSNRQRIGALESAGREEHLQPFAQSLKDFCFQHQSILESIHKCLLDEQLGREVLGRNEHLLFANMCIQHTKFSDLLSHTLELLNNLQIHETTQRQNLLVEATTEHGYLSELARQLSEYCLLIQALNDGLSDLFNREENERRGLGREESLHFDSVVVTEWDARKAIIIQIEIVGGEKQARGSLITEETTVRNKFLADHDRDLEHLEEFTFRMTTLVGEEKRIRNIIIDEYLHNTLAPLTREFEERKKRLVSARKEIEETIRREERERKSIELASLGNFKNIELLQVADLSSIEHFLAVRKDAIRGEHAERQKIETAFSDGLTHILDTYSQDWYKIVSELDQRSARVSLFDDESNNRVGIEQAQDGSFTAATDNFQEVLRQHNARVQQTRKDLSALMLAETMARSRLSNEEVHSRGDLKLLEGERRQIAWRLEQSRLDAEERQRSLLKSKNAQRLTEPADGRQRPIRRANTGGFGASPALSSVAPTSSNVSFLRINGLNASYDSGTLSENSQGSLPAIGSQTKSANTTLSARHRPLHSPFGASYGGDISPRKQDISPRKKANDSFAVIYEDYRTEEKPPAAAVAMGRRPLFDNDNDFTGRGDQPYSRGNSPAPSPPKNPKHSVEYDLTNELTAGHDDMENRPSTTPRATSAATTATLSVPSVKAFSETVVPHKTSDSSIGQERGDKSGGLAAHQNVDLTSKTFLDLTESYQLPSLRSVPYRYFSANQNSRTSSPNDKPTSGGAPPNSLPKYQATNLFVSVTPEKGCVDQNQKEKLWVNNQGTEKADPSVTTTSTSTAAAAAKTETAKREVYPAEAAPMPSFLPRHDPEHDTGLAEEEIHVLVGQASTSGSSFNHHHQYMSHHGRFYNASSPLYGNYVPEEVLVTENNSLDHTLSIASAVSPILSGKRTVGGPLGSREDAEGSLNIIDVEDKSVTSAAPAARNVGIVQSQKSRKEALNPSYKKIVSASIASGMTSSAQVDFASSHADPLQKLSPRRTIDEDRGVRRPQRGSSGDADILVSTRIPQPQSSAGASSSSSSADKQRIFEVFSVTSPQWGVDSRTHVSSLHMSQANNFSRHTSPSIASSSSAFYGPWIFGIKLTEGTLPDESTAEEAEERECVRCLIVQRVVAPAAPQISVGDAVLAVDGNPVSTQREMRRATSDSTDGVVSFQIVRAGKKLRDSEVVFVKGIPSGTNL